MVINTTASWTLRRMDIAKSTRTFSGGTRNLQANSIIQQSASVRELSKV